MPVIIGPSPNLWVQLSNEITCCGLLVGLDDFSDVLEKGMDVLFRGLDEPRAPYSAPIARARQECRVLRPWVTGSVQDVVEIGKP